MFQCGDSEPCDVFNINEERQYVEHVNIVTDVLIWVLQKRRFTKVFFALIYQLSIVYVYLFLYNKWFV